MPQKKIVLFFPSYASREASPPLALIAIAGPLVREGYRVEIVDSAIEPNFVEEVLSRLDGAICLGISLITGPMIRDTLAVGRAARARYPHLPIVLGGWHPSILPEQTLEAWVQPGPGYLTFDQISAWPSELGLRVRLHRPRYGLRWALRPLLARLRRDREPAHFRIIELIKPE